MFLTNKRSDLLSNAHVSINRLLGDLIQEPLTKDNRELAIAIQYLKDAGKALNATSNILYYLDHEDN